MKKVSIVIPVYNAEKTVKQCLTTVLENDYPDFEVVVVDDCSNDRSEEICSEIDDHRLVLIKNEKNSGASFGRNCGIDRATGEIIILLDADSYVPVDWITRFMELHDKVSADIIGGGIIGVHDTIFGKADGYCTWWTSIPSGKGKYLKKLHLPTNNMSFAKDVFVQIGNFIEELRCGGEDAEFCFRALSKGFKIYFEPNVSIYHYDRNNYKGYIAHNRNFGKHAQKMRTRNKMDFSLIMPRSYLMSYLYILPLAVLYTAFIVAKWVRHDPSVLIFVPIIFYGKIHQAIEIKNSFNHDS